MNVLIYDIVVIKVLQELQINHVIIFHILNKL